MQTMIRLNPNVNGGRGSQSNDPTIKTSEFYTLIEQTFADIEGGTIKLIQRLNNPDAFDLCFYSCSSGVTYTASDIAVFKRTDFQAFAKTKHLLPQRLEEFKRRLVSDELQPTNYR